MLTDSFQTFDASRYSCLHAHYLELFCVAIFPSDVVFLIHVEARFDKVCLLLRFKLFLVHTIFALLAPHQLSLPDPLVLEKRFSLAVRSLHLWLLKLLDTTSNPLAPSFGLDGTRLVVGRLLVLVPVLAQR